MLHLLGSSSSYPAWPGDTPAAKTPRGACMGQGYGVHGSGDVATPSNTAGQQGVTGDTGSFPSPVVKWHSHGVDSLLCRTSLSR